MGRYAVRTPNGAKGPFSRDQIRSFFEKGKLPLSASVVEIETKRLVPIADLVEDPAADILSDDAFLSDPVTEAVPAATAPPPAPPPVETDGFEDFEENPDPDWEYPETRGPRRGRRARSAPGYSGPRTSSARAAPRESRRGGSRRGARTSASRSRRSESRDDSDDYDRGDRRLTRNDNSKVILIVVLVLGLLGCAGGGFAGWLYLWRTDLEGIWKLSPESAGKYFGETARAFLSKEDAAKLMKTKTGTRAFNEGLAEGLDVRLTITPSNIEMTVQGRSNKSAHYGRKSYGRGIYDLTMEGDTERFTVKGNRLEVLTVTKQTLIFSRQ
ncbi:MAG: hypothetical protein AAF517_14270 [Planctomycetota bacterium]